MSEGFDINALLQQAQAMQEQLASAQAEVAEQIVTGQSGGGVVKVEVTGGGEFRSVTIDPACVDASDVGMLEDLVLAALHDASAQLQQLAQEAMGGLGGLGDLAGPGGLGGMLGQ